MKRDEKNELMKRRIMDSALKEFSKKGYGESSVNNVCGKEGISKGIIYHYFDSKGELFLACVRECFDKLTGYIRSGMEADKVFSDTEDIRIDASLNKYFMLRTEFFTKYPVYGRIFSEAVMSPPVHLSGSINKCRAEFDSLSISILKSILSRTRLRKEISMDFVLRLFREFQDYVNIRYQMGSFDRDTFSMREEDCRRIVNILLYGVMERKDKNE